MLHTVSCSVVAAAALTTARQRGSILVVVVIIIVSILLLLHDDIHLSFLNYILLHLKYPLDYTSIIVDLISVDVVIAIPCCKTWHPCHETQVRGPDTRSHSVFFFGVSLPQ